jgi:hypothetical protein
MAGWTEGGKQISLLALTGMPFRKRYNNKQAYWRAIYHETTRRSADPIIVDDGGSGQMSEYGCQVAVYAGATGEIVSIKIGRMRRIPVKALDSFINRCIEDEQATR